jgi:hypothetical protein
MSENWLVQNVWLISALPLELCGAYSGVCCTAQLTGELLRSRNFRPLLSVDPNMPSKSLRQLPAVS